MFYKDDWEKAERKYMEYWNRENHDRPLLNITAPKEKHIPRKIITPDSLIDRWMDTEYIIKSSRDRMSSTFYGAEAFPCINPNLGPDIFGAFLGCKLEFGEDTSWSNHIIENWDEYSDIVFDASNKWWKKIYEMTAAIVEDAKDSYLVGVTDLHPGADGLVALRGPQELCMDLYDYPEEVKRANFQILDVFKKTYTELSNLTIKYQKGTTNWMEIWHPGKWYVTSSDFICMISNNAFSEFILPELLEEIDFFDASIFHLDGPGALKHLDTLLEIPKLNGIQWVYGAGQPTASHWIPTLKKIQEAGKLINVIALPDELELLMENLGPEGVYYQINCESEEQARYLISRAEKFYTGKR